MTSDSGEGWRGENHWRLDSRLDWGEVHLESIQYPVYL